MSKVIKFKPLIDTIKTGLTTYEQSVINPKKKKITDEFVLSLSLKSFNIFKFDFLKNWKTF
jgi:hypothetical protein